jgi:hypothetical protein
MDNVMIERAKDDREMKRRRRERHKKGEVDRGIKRRGRE